MKLQIQLQADGSPTAVQQFEIPFAGDTIVIGRGPESPLPLEGSKLSRNHAAFGVANGALTVTMPAQLPSKHAQVLKISA